MSRAARCGWCAVVAASLSLAAADRVAAQVGGFAGAGGGGFGGGAVAGGAIGGGAVGGAGGAGGAAGGAGGAAGGILIDAIGVVTPIYSKSKSPALAKRRLESLAKEHLSADVNAASPLRKVSLVRLEAACRETIQAQRRVTPEMEHLAGLQRIDYVFVFPETKDVVIAGPAEGFAPDDVGRVVGVNSQRPPLRIDDLIVALRCVERNGGRLGCSIDSVPARMADLERWVRENSTPATATVARARYDSMAEILGMQDVRVWGVPADSHFAQVLVEADYRMKLLSVGLEVAPVRGFRSHLAMLTPGGNSVQRFWFAPLYDAFFTTADRSAFELAGPRAQLLSQEEVTNVLGQRSDAATTRISTQKFAQQFTEKFPELAESIGVFSDLRNLIDLAIVAALVKQERLAERADWTMSLFLDEKQAALAPGRVPKQVRSVANAKTVGGRTVIGLVAGGVEIDAPRIVKQVALREEPGRRLDGVRTAATKTAPPAAQRWWWD
jgi:hypothetical protein